MTKGQANLRLKSYFVPWHPAVKLELHRQALNCEFYHLFFPAVDTTNYAT